MENLLLYCNNQSNTPIIDFKVSGELSIVGRSVSENINEYYQPALDWITGLKYCPLSNISLTIKIECFNTKSSMIILQILKMLEEINSKKLSKVEVYWLYEEDDKDMFESGNDYQSIINLPFNILSLVEN